MKQFLFIGHDASRTGAPMVLLHFLKWLKKERPQTTFDILLLRGGELEDEFRKLGKVYVKNKNRDLSSIEKVCKHLRKRFGAEDVLHIPHPKLLFPKYGAVIANTVVSARYLPFFKNRGLQTFCWAHELEYIVNDYYSIPQFIKIADSIDRFIVPSETGRQMLKSWNIERPVEVIYEFSDVKTTDVKSAAEVREAWNIPENAFVIGGCGTIEWRKGTDLFIQLAASLTKIADDIYFAWVGSPLDEGNVDQRRMSHDLKRLGHNKQLIFTGSTDRPHDLFNAMDVFALTSREDPFPLVCMEAASLGKPVLCFAGAGGMPEFVENDAGAIIPYGDVDAFSSKILELYNDRELCMRLGEKARVKVKTRFAADLLCEKLFNYISDGITPDGREQKP